MSHDGLGGTVDKEDVVDYSSYAVHQLVIRLMIDTHVEIDHI